MIEAGVHLGLPRTTATELVIQTLVGSAKMLRETGTHPTVLREQVTSPGGTTASALRELEIHKVRAAFLAAMEAARDRSQLELAEGELGGQACRCVVGRRRPTRPAGTIPPTTWCRAPCSSPARSRCRPGGADLALALPDRGRAVLLRLDRQPRPSQPAAAHAGRRRARGRASDGGRLPADLVRRGAPVDGRSPRRAASGCSARSP